MASLNDMVLQLSSTNDTKKKLTIGQDIIDHLGQPENSVECDDLGGFIDTLVPFMQSSNFKVFIFIILKCYNYFDDFLTFILPDSGR